MKLSSCLVIAFAQLALAIAPARGADFDGDGADDLAILVEYETTGLPSYNSAVHVLYGVSGSGLGAARNQFLLNPGKPPTPGIGGGDFGTAMACGDWNGDGFTDLAVSLPFEDVNGKKSCGAVYEYLGSPDGLVLRRALHQDLKGIKEHAETGDFFGISLAAGDFDGDGKDDLAIGVDESIAGFDLAGAVHVVYGGKHGLSKRDAVWHQDRKGILDEVDGDEAFGRSIAAGDFDGDGRDDLAIGISGEERIHDGAVTAGAVAVLFGSKKGVNGKRDTLFDAIDAFGPLPDEAVGFGDTLATGDFNGDGRDELVISATYLGGNFLDPLGAVAVVATQQKKLKPDVALRINAPAIGGLFAESLATGDFDHDGTDDLVIGAPFQDNGAVEKAGAVHIVMGNANGLVVSQILSIGQETTDVLGAAGELDIFGWSIAVADFDSDGSDDLAIGVPNDKSPGNVSTAGSVNVLYGFTGVGLSTVGNQLWYQDLLGGGQVASPFERFGALIGS